MNNSAYITESKKTDQAVLIVDKVGVLGEKLALELSKDFFVVFLTRRPLSQKNNQISQVLFKGKIPKAPQNLYSKIFLVDDGEAITRESASSFLARAIETNAEFYFLGGLRNTDVEETGDIAKSYDKAKVLVFGDLFDKEFLFDRSSSITKFLIQAKNEGKIKVPGDGLALSYPITLEDTVKLIIKATSLNTPQKIILLFYKDPITDISLANIFQKIDPDIKVDFASNENKQKIYIPVESNYALSKYDIKKALEEVGIKREDELIIIDKEKRKIHPMARRSLGLLMLIFLFLVLLPFITTEAYLFLGEMQINNAKNIAERGDFENALEKANNSKTFFEMARKTSAPLSKEVNFIGLSDQAKSIREKIDSGENLSLASSQILKGVIVIRNVYSGNSTNPKDDLETGVNSLSEAYSLIQKSELQGKMPGNINREFGDILPLISLLSNSSGVLPKILGFDSEKTYLILFQNNQQIRPGGGVVEAVGVLSINAGKIDKFQVLNTKDLDEKLNTHVEPPFAVRRYLHASNFYLKDSSSDPNFVNDAINAASIYKLETGTEVDGVIGINLNFIKDLITNLGSVKVDGVGEVNSKNIYSISQKADDKFMQQLVNSVGKKFFQNTKKQYFSNSRVVGQALARKEILFALKDQDIQSIFSAEGLSSDLVDNRTQTQNQIKDYFGISEEDFSEKGINNFISRSVSKEVVIGNSGKVSSVATVAFSNSNPEIIYRNYFELILPEGSRIEEVSVGGRKVDTIPAVTDFLTYEKKGFVAPKKLEIEEREEANKSVFGFLIVISPQSVETIKITYSIPFRISTGSPAKYSLLINKQPGVEPYPFDLTFSLPKNTSVLPVSSYSGEILKDQELNFILTQN
jgi:hypothetical protein